MILPRQLRRFPLWCVLPALLLAACGSQQPSLAGAAASQPVDFTGSWELDYSQSDNIQVRFNTLVRELRRDAQRRANGTLNQSGGSLMVGGGGANSGASIIGLAQMADLITQSQLLEITQDERDIKVKREATFALTCEFYPGRMHTVETPLGSEVCGWNAHQLVFRILLPEGLSIQHQMTLDPAGERLKIATTVVSDQVSYPFTLNRVYRRFEPRDNGITCKMTLSRGRVCTTEAQ